MLYRVMTLIALALCFSVTPAWAQDNATQEAASELEAKEFDPAKVEAAERYLANIDLESSFDNIYDALQSRLPQEYGAPVIALMRQKVRMDEVHKVVMETLMSHYTLEELQALAKFYSSEVGRSVTKKLPAYLNDVNIAIQAEAQRAFESSLGEVQAQVQKAKEAQKAQAEQEAEEGDAADAEQEDDAAEAAE